MRTLTMVCTCRLEEEDTCYKTQCFDSTVRVLGTELKIWAWETSTCTHWPISPALLFFLWRNDKHFTLSHDKGHLLPHRQNRKLLRVIDKCHLKVMNLWGKGLNQHGENKQSKRIINICPTKRLGVQWKTGRKVQQAARYPLKAEIFSLP